MDNVVDLRKSIAWFHGVPVTKGSSTSGNFAHRGRPKKRGGSAPGGGHGAIGVPAGATPDEVEQAVETHRDKPQDKLQGIASIDPEQVATRDLNTAINGDLEDVKKIARHLGWSDDRISGLPERALRNQLAAKRMSVPAEDWLKQQGDDVIVYHGTTTEALSTILNEGLQARESTFANIGQEAGVFGVADNNIRWAEFWANKAAERLGGRPVVLELRIPKKDMQLDLVNPRDFMLSNRDVPASNILSSIELRPTSTKDFPFSVTVPDPRGGDNTISVKDTFVGR